MLSLTCGFVKTWPPMLSRGDQRNGLGRHGLQLIENRGGGLLQVLLCSRDAGPLVRPPAAGRRSVPGLATVALPTEVAQPLTTAALGGHQDAACFARTSRAGSEE